MICLAYFSVFFCHILCLLRFLYNISLIMAHLPNILVVHVASYKFIISALKTGERSAASSCHSRPGEGLVGKVRTEDEHVCVWMSHNKTKSLCKDR